MTDRISRARLKDLAKLKSKKFRDREEKYLISGERALKGALSGMGCHVDSFLVEESLHIKSQELQHAYPILQLAKTWILTTREFRSITDEKNPQGLAIVTCKPKSVHPQLPANRQPVIYLDRINDPGNLGTIIRTAAWFGVTTVLLSPESADPFQGKSVRASTGMITQMQIFENIDSELLISLRTQWNYKLVSSVLTQGIPLWKLKNISGLLLLFGSEAEGLKDELVEMSDMIVQIPKIGNGESLNLGIATGCFLYHITTPEKKG